MRLSASLRLCVKWPVLLLALVSFACAQQSEIDEGAQVFQSNCAVCHGPDGDAVEGIDFAKGRFKRAAQDSDIARVIAGGVPGTGMPPFDLRTRDVGALLAYFRFLRAGVVSVAAGDAASGQALFEGKGGCLECHRIDRKGSRVGPDLSQIGRTRTAPMLEQSILEPDAVVLQEHLYCKAVTRDGVTITGRRLNEDPTTVQLIDTSERLIGLSKADLREYTLLRTSPMPSYRGKMTPAEIGDIVKYLTTRKGTPQP